VLHHDRQEQADGAALVLVMVTEIPHYYCYYYCLVSVRRRLLLLLLLRLLLKTKHRRRVRHVRAVAVTLGLMRTGAATVLPLPTRAGTATGGG
jgi:hypothetical protein